MTHARLETLCGDLNLSSPGRELDRVGQDVPDDLLEPLRIRRNRADVVVDEDLELDTPRICGRPHRLRGSLDGLGDFGRVDLHAKPSARHS